MKMIKNSGSSQRKRKVALEMDSGHLGRLIAQDLKDSIRLWLMMSPGTHSHMYAASVLYRAVS